MNTWNQNNPNHIYKTSVLCGYYILSIAFATVFATHTKAQTLLGPEQQQASLNKIAGTWINNNASDHQLQLALTPDAQFQLNQTTGPFTLQLNTITLQTPTGPLTYNYKLNGNQLTLSGADLTQDLTLTRQFNLKQYLAQSLDLTADSLWQKTYRIAFILAVVIAARIILAILHVISHAMIFWSWGPFALFYRHQKNRAKTVHSLLLNVIKYFVYFTALGMILSELGINYATYLASLSVVGLAIGFGSQGLVQDMVTGFFIIFEAQFDVGDMVEISGQTGYVTDIGLRMTKIRNYHGQTVVIPNRNIAVVGNYHHGAQRVYIDVHVATPNDARTAVPLAKQLADQLAHQYHETILLPINASHIQLENNQHFTRLHLSIWPNQTWVIDKQLIPRLQQTLANHGLDIPTDKITAHYHPRKPPRANKWRQRFNWFSKPKQHQA